MNQKKATREKTKFSKLRLRSNSTKSYKLCSPRSQEKISSYFSSALNDTEISTNLENKSNENDSTPNLENTSEDEPDVIKLRKTKSTTSESCTDNDTPDDTNDFTKPKLMNIKTKLKNKSSRFENVAKRNNQIVSKTKVDHFIVDTNQEHLQLAIAMSKSIMEVENPQEAESEINIFPSTQQKIMKVKQTLDQFGFKSGRNSAQISSKPNVKMTKGKKFKYCTPTLFLRTDQDRTKLIENKVSQIINNISIYNNTIQEKHVNITNNEENKPRSFILRDYYKENPTLFNKNSLSLENAKDNVFYNGIVVPSNIEVGVLLKDWSTIPGRESTPPLDETISPNEIETKSMDIPQVPVTPIEISMSPELFADSDEDVSMEQNENNKDSRKELMNPTNLLTFINNENILESDCSTKSVSLLDDSIKGKHMKRTLITHTESSSLSPFAETVNHMNKSITKQLKPMHNFQNNNGENSDSLSPFEPVHTETTKSPKRKVTPKKKSPSPKKIVVTPKGHRVISSDNQKKNSPCKRSILFTDKKDNNSNKSNEIAHFESFCNDTIECFDLTHSSDDEILNLDEVNKDNDTTNKSITVTQLIKELSPGKCKKNNTEIESTTDSQASIETLKLNISKCVDSDLNEEFSPEFDCLNLSNNKVFYETLNNSLLFKNDDIIPLETSESQLQNESSLVNSDEIVRESCDDDVHENKEVTSTPIRYKHKDNSFLNTPLSNKELEHSFLSPNCKANKKRKSSLLRRSYSENFINNKIIPQESTTLGKSFRLSLGDNEIEQNDEIERNENAFLSQLSISTCSDISDEELNYSCNSMFKKYNLSDKVISISDEERDGDLTSATETEKETTTEYDLNIQKCIDNAYKNNFCNVNKSIQHPRILELSTPIKAMASDNLSNYSKDKEENIINENYSSNNVATPKTNIIINRENITPKGYYSNMDTPEINRELEKYGLKSMKRSKGVKILHYIYDSTHPYENDSNDGKIVNSSSEDEIDKAVKRKKIKNNENCNEVTATQNEKIFSFENIEQNRNQIADSEKVEDMIFERKPSLKISSCRMPLHVAWNNLLISSKELQENILTYTPVQVEEIYKQLKKFGYKFHIQDIIAFLDKKCITIKIAQNNRNQRK